MAILPQNRSAPWDEAVILALGGNLAGDYRSPAALLEAAVASLPAVRLRVLSRSAPWRSCAWPDPAEPDYANLVAVVETALTPRETLAAALALELRFGRERGWPNAPRTLDIDLIAFGRQIIDEPGLVVPHPRAHLRRFVMGPLAQLAPDWRHPVLGLTAGALAAAATIGVDARPA